uniref:Tau95_N domain-containing protein n=1 Tax=Macrostomum lignano TaxID=282301 RepID=A0A1I8IFS8_9PLAT
MSVVKEIPVYLSKQAIHDLLLFEFPNRPKDNLLKPSSIIDCKYKPKAQCAELSLAVDTKSPNYERHRGQELGQLAPEQFPRGQFDRQLLRSMPKAGQQQQQQNRFVVARFHDNRLTLCPISSTARLVMQPVLEHLDSAAAKSSTEQQSNAGAAGDDADAARAVTLRFARQETPEARQRREQSYRVCQRLLEQEPWTGCQWLSVDEDQPLRSNDEFLLGVVNSNSENEPVAMDTREPVPKTGGEAREAGAMGSSGNSSELYLRPPVPSGVLRFVRR